MKIKKIFLPIVLSTFIFGCTFIETVENSIVSAIEESEVLERLPEHKYSKNQFSQIAAALKHKEERLRIVSFNMLANDADHKREEINRWPQRLLRIVEIIEEIAPDVIGAQELYQTQLEELFPYISPTFGFYGEPRQDGELNGVFYRKSRFELVKGRVWDIPQTGPIGNNLTMLQLRDLLTGQLFAIFNIHLAFGANEREEEVRFIIQQILPIAQRMPVMLTGDLNTFPNRLDLERLPFYDGDYIHRLLTKNIFKDSSEVSLLGHLGPISTFTNAPGDGIPFQGKGTPGVLLDRIYVSKGMMVLIHAVQSGKVNGHFPSDHMPVIIDILIRNR